MKAGSETSAAGEPLLTSDPPTRLLETPLGAISVAEEGRTGAPAVLCVHGIPGSARDFRYLGPQLAERLRVVRVEMPGFGSSAAGQVAALPGWAEVVIAVADALSLARFAVLGHSFGGGAALLAGALAGERLAGLVLLASMGGRRHRGFLLPCAVYAYAAELARHRLVWPLAAALARFAYRTNGLRPPIDDATLVLHMQLLGSVEFDALTMAARRVTAPTLVVHAADDRLVEPDIGRALAREFARGSHVELDVGGHHLNRTRPREVAAAVFDLLACGQ